MYEHDGTDVVVVVLAVEDRVVVVAVVMMVAVMVVVVGVGQSEQRVGQSTESFGPTMAFKQKDFANVAQIGSTSGGHVVVELAGNGSVVVTVTVVAVTVVVVVMVVVVAVVVVVMVEDVEFMPSFIASSMVRCRVDLSSGTVNEGASVVVVTSFAGIDGVSTQPEGLQDNGQPAP
jgi:hypothetical protein